MKKIFVSLLLLCTATMTVPTLGMDQEMSADTTDTAMDDTETSTTETLDTPPTSEEAAGQQTLDKLLAHYHPHRTADEQEILDGELLGNCDDFDEHGNLGYIKKLVAAKANVNGHNEDGQTLLHMAVTGSRKDTDRFALAKFLISNGASVNIHDECGNFPVHFSVFENASFAKLFIKYGACLNNARNTLGASPLNLTMIYKKPELMRLFFLFGATPFNEPTTQLRNKLMQEYPQKIAAFIATRAAVSEKMISPLADIVTGYVFKHNPPLPFEQTVARNVTKAQKRAQAIQENVRARAAQLLSASSSPLSALSSANSTASMSDVVPHDGITRNPKDTAEEKHDADGFVVDAPNTVNSADITEHGFGGLD